jgi:hypothetical protein
MRDIHALGEYSIKIKYFVGRFISDVGIIHTGYVPRRAAKPPSGYLASLISGYPYCASRGGPFRARGKSGGVGTNRSYEMLLKTVSRYILILSL